MLCSLSFDFYKSVSKISLEIEFDAEKCAVLIKEQQWKKQEIICLKLSDFQKDVKHRGGL